MIPLVISSVFLLAAVVDTIRAHDAVVCGTQAYKNLSGNLSYNANAWNPTNGGFSCVAINNSIPSFDATWMWPSKPEASSVHSYPYVAFNSSYLPLAVTNISTLRLSVDWGLVVESSSAMVGQIDATGLQMVNARSNIAFDMFLDEDPAKAGSAVNASTEIMIWIGTIGSPRPLGYESTQCCTSIQLEFGNFTLYTGKNHRGTSVYTWVSNTNITTFNADISTLLAYLWSNNLISANLRLGKIEFGLEAYYSESNITFSGYRPNMDLKVDQAPTPPFAKSGSSFNIPICRTLNWYLCACIGALVTAYS